MCRLADLKLDRLLDTLDAWAVNAGIEASEPPERFAATRVPSPPPLALDLRRDEIRTIIWATG